MRLIVGLGNPGRKYSGTRHNVGWEVIGELARRHGQGRPRVKFQGEVVDAEIRGEKVVLLCPQTFMNLSGASVQPARDFYKLTDQELIVVCDDFHLTLAQLRFRAKGSSGGQKGLQDIIRRLGSDCFSRLRIGIGDPPEGWEVSDFVLSRFSDQERKDTDAAIKRAADGLAEWVQLGIDHCMNRYNSS